ncbi:MAG TPA: alpha-amylase/4-alpha-glucanotransferase domain-containing protein [Candidatus Saccharimonadia bacterium]|nr:alpha-amylase/4-alpha-glucanotransferase domain-containing protein [Candidatus Saccharimonadia bacterium]
MGPRIALALAFHNHQPVGNFGWVIEDTFRTAYEPMLAALERHPGVRVGLHYSGPLLEWLVAEQPQAVARLAALADRGQVEILGGGWTEPILISLPVADRIAQLRRMGDELAARFGRRPRGAWLAERVWEPSLPADLVRGGYEWTILDDNHLRAASVAEDAMWGTFTTDDLGERLTVFGTEQGLRYRIPFGEVDDLIAYLREHATEDGGRVGMMGDDGEKFGAWPTTYEHCWGAGRWVDRCFEALEANAAWLTTTTPSDWLEREPPVGRIYVPTASYVEMTEWAMPADESGAFHDALARARAGAMPEARFLRGGFWRNFQARYREVNDLHKQMLRVSAKVAAMPDGSQRATAVDQLQRGQSNDCYWHGLFGGIYIVHMRMATLHHLIAAEDLADTAARASGADPDDAHVSDWDLDGRPDAVLASPAQLLTVDLDEGAGISTWDLRASRVAVLAAMRRRPEAYHARLIEHDARAAATGDEDAQGTDGGTVSIHDIVAVKEEGLSAYLQYDGHERRGALVRILEPGLTAAALRGDEGIDRIAVDGPWTMARLGQDRLDVRREVDGLSLERRLRIGGPRLAPWLEVEVDVVNRGPGAIDADLAIEWSVCLSGGGGNPAAYYEVTEGRGARATAVRSPHDGAGDLATADRLAFGNDHDGVRVDATIEPPARMTWFPIETVSNSEGGFERVYQGSSLLARWPLGLAPGGSISVRQRFAIAEARDLAIEAIAG